MKNVFNLGRIFLKGKAKNRNLLFVITIMLLLFVSLQGQLNQLYAADNTQSAQKETAYPTTPEEVVEAFIKANYSEEAIKKYWLDITDDNALKKYKKNYGIYFDCKEWAGHLVTNSIYDSFTIKRNKKYRFETDVKYRMTLRDDKEKKLIEKDRKGEIAGVSVFFNLTAFYQEGGQINFLPSGIKKALAINQTSAPGCLGFLLIKSNNRWKIESARFTDECSKMLDDFYAKWYKNKKPEDDGTIMIDTPISKECLIEGIKNKIEKYKDDKEFVNGLEDCLKAIEEKRNCRAYGKK
jgi:hypothetical protein